MARPTQHQINAVHKVLYRPERLRQLEDHTVTIASLMNLQPGALYSPQDIRNPPGSGPNWFYAVNGEQHGALDGAVHGAADRCDRIAKLLLDTRRELESVGFPHTDKQHLMAALEQEAAAWSARGAVWRSPNRPNVDLAVQEIFQHLQVAIDEVKHVKRYLKPKHEVMK